MQTKTDYWHIYSCNLCLFLGLEQDFRFNPTYRNSMARILSQCPVCGTLGCHAYGYIWKDDNKRERLKTMRWERRYFFWRDNEKPH